MVDEITVETRRWIDHHRFQWHEKILMDAKIRKNPTALALAGHIMHRVVAQKGWAQFSNQSAATALSMEVRSVARAKNCLIERGWIRLHSQVAKRGRGWGANRYILAGGPDDLLFDAEPHQ